jgi:hypothetical protein
VQRIIVQRIAFKFHTVAYRDRLATSRKELKIFDSIIKGIRRSGIADSIINDDIKNLFSDHEIDGDETDSEENERHDDQNVNDTGIVGRRPKSEESFVTEVVDSIRVNDTADSADVYVLQLDSTLETETHPLKTLSRQGSQFSQKSKTTPSNLKKTRKEQNNGTITIGGREGSNRVKSGNRIDKEARHLTCFMFSTLTKESGRTEILKDDLKPFFESEEDTTEAFNLFDLDGNGSVNSEEILFSIQRMVDEKKNLLASLSDLSKALGQLNSIFFVFSAFATFIICMPVFGIELASVLSLTSFFLGLSFIFGGGEPLS